LYAVEFALRDLFIVLGFVLSLAGFWYKMNSDIAEKIDKVRESSASKTDVSQIKDDVASMRANAISRQEHDRDIEKVKEEIRTFRDEVREDIRSLSHTLSTRFDIMMQRMFDIQTDQKKP
jgi:hypothetical protein